MSKRIPPFKSFVITQKTNNLTKRKVTIAKRRYMSKDCQITIELDTGWPGRWEKREIHGATVGEFRQIIEDFMRGRL